MNTNIAIPSTATGRIPLHHARWKCYWLEAKYEFLRQLRTPAFALPALSFPVLFYLLFGVMMTAPGGNGAATSTYLLVTYGVFGIMGPALFGFGVGLAMDRDMGLLKLKRALPVPAGALLLSKTAMAMVFGLIITGMLMAVATGLAGVRLDLGQFALLALVNLLGVLPFCAMGLWIGTLVGGQAAVAIVNLVYLPMAFLSGLWIPLSILPDFIARLAPLWPAYHLSQIALKVIDRDAGGSLALHAGVLAVVAVAFFVLAHARLQRVG